jgi:ppGpp synthetase/RelA/SpoT-type nucleotidyltranferase
MRDADQNSNSGRDADVERTADRVKKSMSVMTKLFRKSATKLWMSKK